MPSSALRAPRIKSGACSSSIRFAYGRRRNVPGLSPSPALACFQIHISFSSLNPLNSATKTSVIPAVSRDPDYQPSHLWNVQVPAYRHDDRIFLNQFHELNWFKQSATREKICESNNVLAWERVREAGGKGTLPQLLTAFELKRRWLGIELFNLAHSSDATCMTRACRHLKGKFQKLC